jgi:hypothetical protein
LIDSNVFVAAIKNPRKRTRTLELLLKMIEDPTIGLVGNDLLMYEMVRYAELLKSPTAAALVAAPNDGEPDLCEDSNDLTTGDNWKLLQARTTLTTVTIGR